MPRYRWFCVLCKSVKLFVLVTQEILNVELKSRVQELMRATPNTAERSCLQKVLALLESC